MSKALIKLCASKLNGLLLLPYPSRKNSATESQSKRERGRSFGPKITTNKPNSTSTILFFSLLILALTGVVCTHKIQAEEECLSTNVLCYECDSKSDPNCADPFDFSSDATLFVDTNTNPQSLHHSTTNSSRQQNNNDTAQPIDPTITSSIIPTSSPPAQRIPKKFPSHVVCHGCCVKLTSKLPDGSNYVKRTCTTNLQINYFMVGLVCMKESGDRGKMCFCETDYCNGQASLIQAQQSLSSKSKLLVISTITILIIMSLLS